jgi:drug/metabolite transporter (DMT)-like permease
MKRMKRSAFAWPGAPLALASAALFGASTPLAKLLLGSGVDPWLLAGLLYLGSGVGLCVIVLARRWLGILRLDAPLRRSDAPWLALGFVRRGARSRVADAWPCAHRGLIGRSAPQC